MKYRVMVSIEVRSYDGEYDCYDEEYTGTIYDSRAEARKEFLQACEDINVDYAYIECIG